MNEQQANHKDWIERRIAELIPPQKSIETNPANRAMVEMNSNMQACRFVEGDQVSLMACYILGIPEKGADPIGAAIVFRHDGARLYELAGSIQGGALADAAVKVAARYAGVTDGLIVEKEGFAITNPVHYAKIVEALVQDNYCIGLDDIGFESESADLLISQRVEPYEWVNGQVEKHDLQRDGVLDPDMPLTKVDQDRVLERYPAEESQPVSRHSPRM